MAWISTDAAAAELLGLEEHDHAPILSPRGLFWECNRLAARRLP